MQIMIQAKCSLSPTGAHPVTFTFGVAGGRGPSGQVNSIVGISCGCEASDPAVDVARTMGEPTCCDALVAFLKGMPADDSSFEDSVRDLCATKSEAGLIQRVLATGVTGAHRAHTRRRERRPGLRTPDFPGAGPVPAHRSDRWQSVLNSRLRATGLQYTARAVCAEYADHTGAPGLAIEFPTGECTDRNRVGIFAPYGTPGKPCNRVHVYRGAGVTGNYSTSVSGKPDWCKACGCPVRGMARHVVSAGHKAVVRRDLFKLARAMFPHRVVKEAPHESARALVWRDE